MNYSTSFAGTENPLSEGATWDNAPSGNASYSNVRKTPGFAHATQDPATQFDSQAIVSGVGAFTKNQTAQATCLINVASSHTEVGLLLNYSFAGPNIKGYEIGFTTSGLVGITRIDDAPSQTFVTVANQVALPNGALVTGNVVKATNVNGLITGYVDVGAGFVQVIQGTDTTYTTGTFPGIGFFLDATLTSANDGDVGFSDFSAQDDAAPSVFVEPTSLRMVGRKYV